MFSCNITFSGSPLSAPRLKSRCDPLQLFRKPTGVGFRNWLNPRSYTVTFLAFRKQVVFEQQPEPRGKPKVRHPQEFPAPSSLGHPPESSEQ